MSEEPNEFGLDSTLDPGEQEVHDRRQDQQPLDLDGLGRWQVQDELIRAQAIAAARDARLTGIQRRGDLLAAAFGQALADERLAWWSDPARRCAGKSVAGVGPSAVTPFRCDCLTTRRVTECLT